MPKTSSGREALSEAGHHHHDKRMFVLDLDSTSGSTPSLYSDLESLESLEQNSIDWEQTNVLKLLLHFVSQNPSLHHLLDTNKISGISMLHFVVQLNEAGLLRLLRQYIPTICVNAFDRQGYAPIHRLIVDDHGYSCMAMLDQISQLNHFELDLVCQNHKDAGKSPLELAIDYCHPLLLESLLDKLISSNIDVDMQKLLGRIQRLKKKIQQSDHKSRPSSDDGEVFGDKYLSPNISVPDGIGIAYSPGSVSLCSTVNDLELMENCIQYFLNIKNNCPELRLAE